ncbi:MAG: hypothetical protein BWX80_00515 [Candidatus Hydrogenedentes bacterium ADurb.Bin101]|jgi:hypothetical protein|nr:MAG: hypothetical protein BWX80_00515 [Candidatus Hydrogenedentes bacterium ADurb.Bin101]HOC68629.1 hypothetical protein [Candidatus Hydrogenedentota bacterium]
MARVIWHYQLNKQEQRLWEREELRGWREAMQGFVEDEAREQGFTKYAIYNLDNILILKDSVSSSGESEDSDI